MTIKNKKYLVNKTKHLWLLTYLEPTQGWPTKWTVIWRTYEYHGKISGSIESKSKPDEKRVAKELVNELSRRFDSNLMCDAKRVAKIYLTEPLIAEIKGCQKEIENLIRENANELGNLLTQVCENLKLNELMQRIKDIAQAQEHMSEIDKYIDNKKE